MLRAEQPRSLRRWLLYLAIFGTSASLIIAAITGWWSWQEQKDRIGTSLMATSRAMAEAVDRELDQAAALGRGLAISSLLAGDDFVGFERQARQAISPYGYHLVLTSPNSEFQLVNTQVPPGAEQPTLTTGPIDPALRQDRIHVSTLAKSRVSDAWFTSVDVPVPDPDGQLRFVLSMFVPSAAFQRIIDEQHLPTSWSPVILDADWSVVARDTNRSKFIGQKGAAQVFQHDPDGLHDVRLLDGDRALSAHSHSRRYGWTVAIAMPIAAMLKQALAPMLAAALGGFAVAAIAIGAVLLLTTRIGSNIGALAAATRALAKGENLEFPRFLVRELALVGDGMQQAAAEIAAARHGLEARVAEATQQLRQERALSELIIENAAEGIIVIDMQFRHLMWNAGMERINGLSRREVLGKTVFEVFPHLLDHPVGQAWRDALAGRRVELRGRHYHSPSRGIAITYDSDHTPLYDHAGAIVGAVCIVRDTTEHHRVEDMLRQSQKMEAVGQLTGGIAHDFNNLLTVIQGSMELLDRYRGQPIQPQTLERLLGPARTATQRGAALTHRLLAFSRKQALSPQDIDINRHVAGMSELLHRTLGESISIETVLASGVWRCFVDPSQLENALLNLAVNARDAMPGGGKLTIETGNSLLDEEYAATQDEVLPGQYVLVAVSDTGSGMTPETMAHAIEPFFTTKGPGRGTGLGLSQVYGFVKQSGGHINLYSEVGQGTTVKIYLPRHVALGAPSEPKAARSQPVTAADNETILLVEDDPDVRAFSLSALTNLGYCVLEAADADAALAILGQHSDVALMLTDVGLPGLNGRQLADEARRRFPGLRVVYMTAYARNAIVHHGRLDAGVDLISKPFTTEALGRKLQEVLRREQIGPCGS